MINGIHQTMDKMLCQHSDLDESEILRAVGSLHALIMETYDHGNFKGALEALSAVENISSSFNSRLSGMMENTEETQKFKSLIRQLHETRTLCLRYMMLKELKEARKYS